MRPRSQSTPGDVIVQDITIKKPTKGNPTMVVKFAELQSAEKATQIGEVPEANGRTISVRALRPYPLVVPENRDWKCP